MTPATPELPHGVTATPICAGITAYDVATPACRGRILDHGAHVTQYAPAGGPPVIFTSDQARYEPGAAIRGGIPICLPWFGDGAGTDGRPGGRSPAHGYARTARWSMALAERTGDVVRLEFRLDSTEVAGAAEKFTARLVASFGAELELRLSVTARAPLTIQEALHAYLAVTDVRRVQLRGLAPAYFDKLTREPAGGAADPAVLTGPTDRVYPGRWPVRVLDPAGRSLLLAASGASNTIVWNPWAEGAAAMGDLGPGEWTRFVCVEAGCVDPSVRLGPGETHELALRVGVDGDAEAQAMTPLRSR